MSRVILLLPAPDILQVANCYKYITRPNRTYSKIYTLTTIKGQCDANTTKILVIGHGDVGKLIHSSPAEVAQAIAGSGMPLDAGGKIALDTCYAGSRGTNNDQSSALHLLRVALKKINFNCNLYFVGAISPTVTIGGLTAKRIVVPEKNLSAAGNLQAQFTKKHSVNPGAPFPNWSEKASSDQIKGWAKLAHGYLIGFAKEFRQSLTTENYRDVSDTRKVRLQA